MIEPSDAEQATWPDATRDYVHALAARIERLRAALTQIASGNVFETAFPTLESITAPELEDGYLVASEFARVALQAPTGGESNAA